MLWTELLTILDPSYSWICLGDFNMVTSVSDHCGGEWCQLCGREAHLWAKLVRKFNWFDTFAPMADSLKYSWDNQRTHHHNPENLDFETYGNRTLRRLDHIYAPVRS